MTAWIHWKRNRLKSSKRDTVLNATLWHQLDAAVARQAKVELTWVKARNGTILNACADQLATMADKWSTYGPIIETPEDEMDDEAD
jgi:ribonuclease HI